MSKHLFSKHLWVMSLSEIISYQSLQYQSLICANKTQIKTPGFTFKQKVQLEFSNKLGCFMFRARGDNTSSLIYMLISSFYKVFFKQFKR